MLMDTPNKILKARLAQLKVESKLTWPQIESESGYSANYIQKILRGKRINPTITFVWAMARTFKVTPASMLGWETTDGTA